MKNKGTKSGVIKAVITSLFINIVVLIILDMTLDYSYADMFKTHAIMRLDAIKILLVCLNVFVTFWGYLIWKELNLINKQTSSIKD